MKKLIAIGVILAVFATGLLIQAARSPSNGIVGISREQGRDYSAWTVLYRGGSFEQLIRDTRHGRTFRHQGTWQPAKNDIGSQLLLEQTKTPNSDGYLELKSPVEAKTVVKNGAVPAKGVPLLTPGSFFQVPREAQLKEIEAFAAR